MGGGGGNPYHFFKGNVKGLRRSLGKVSIETNEREVDLIWWPGGGGGGQLEALILGLHVLI